MDGVTDWVHRELATRLGGVSQCVTEFVRVTDSAPPRQVFLRTAPELTRDGRTHSGVPVFVQLLGGVPQAMAQAAQRAAELGAPGIDINFGCPAKRVNNHDGGASILKCSTRVETITRAVRDAVPAHIPVTAKIRLGWADAERVIETAQAVERAGASWLTIHGRTKSQMYAPPVDYAAIGRARAAVRIPVVANGDITCHERLLLCARESGCGAFMVGRGALAHPFVFRELRGEATARDLPSYCDVLLQYERLMADGGFEPIGRLCRLKQWLGLGVQFAPELRAFFEAFKRETELLPALRRCQVSARNAA
jgi:tRNA-dihydrouridine synthase C